MKRMIKFDSSSLGYMGMEVPDHTQEAIVNYLIHGLQPGGFLTAILTGDVYRATQTADTANRRMLWAICKWVMDNAPCGSWGSPEAFTAWLGDTDGCRSRFSTEIEQEYITEVLSKS